MIDMRWFSADARRLQKEGRKYYISMSIGRGKRTNYIEKVNFVAKSLLPCQLTCAFSDNA